ncbi:unnamed protein product [Discosporangium mesarthrocarpum]
MSFAWGVATSAYQIEGGAREGGRSPSIWDVFCKQPGRVKGGDSGDVAIDFYHRFREDIKLVQALGIKHFRMSISWSRVLPEGTASNPNATGVAFYKEVFTALRDAGISPWVTLFHWDLPQALEERGGFLNSDVALWFKDYADFCFQEFGGQVDKWITFNEPQCFAWSGYGVGVHAPGRGGCGQSGDRATEPYTVMHNILLSHAKAAQAFRIRLRPRHGSTEKKGAEEEEDSMAINSDWGEPYDPGCPEDADAARRYVEFWYGWSGDPVNFGHYPESMAQAVGDRLPRFSEEESRGLRGSCDFLGVNYYTSRYVRHRRDSCGGRRGWDVDVGATAETEDVGGRVIGPRGGTDWEYAYPIGLRRLLRWVDVRYGHPILFVFENGASEAASSGGCPESEGQKSRGGGKGAIPGGVGAEEDQASPGEKVWESEGDAHRVWYLKEHLRSVREALCEDGVDLRGYFCWTLWDNFEWSDGYSVQFGLVHVDFKSPQLTRTPRPSAHWYARYIASHSNMLAGAEQGTTL